MKRIIPGIISIALILTLCVPQFALDTYAAEPASVFGNLWDTFDLLNDIYEDVEDRFEEGKQRHMEEMGWYSIGEVESVLGGGGYTRGGGAGREQAALFDFQERFGGTSINSDGFLLVKLPLYSYEAGATSQYYDITFGLVSSELYGITYQLLKSGSGSSAFKVLYRVAVPVNGYYSLYPTSFNAYYKYYYTNGSTINEWRYFYIDPSDYIFRSGLNISYRDSTFYPSKKYLSAGASFEGTISGGSAMSVTSRPYYVYVPHYITALCEPADSLLQQSADQLRTGGRGRLGNVVESYGYYDENDNPVYVEDKPIVSETNNYVYNPVTGDTYNITTWNYDYSTRTYNTVTESGSNVNVIFGDECIVIEDGENTYNVYYIAAASSGNTDPGTDPGTNPGGNGGNNSGDNGSSGGGIWDTILGFLVDIIGPIISAIVKAIVSLFGYVVDGLTAFVDLLLRLFTEIPKMFSGFTEFLAAMFPFVPDEFVTLILFGLVALIVTAIIKKFIG